MSFGENSKSAICFSNKSRPRIILSSRFCNLKNRRILFFARVVKTKLIQSLDGPNELAEVKTSTMSPVFS